MNDFENPSCPVYTKIKTGINYDKKSLKLFFMKKKILIKNNVFNVH